MPHSKSTSTSKKKGTKSTRLVTQHTKLRCLRCHRKATMPESTYVAAIATRLGVSVNCCFGQNGIFCGGQMVRFGGAISRPRTLAQLPTYAWARDRALRGRRGAALVAEQTIGDMDPEDIDDSDGTDDPDFVLSRDFFINMRFTPEDMEPARPTPTGLGGGLLQLAEMTTDLVTTGNPDFAERIKSTKAYAAPGKSAWQYALDQGAPNAMRYRVGSLAHYEWCHLQGVCIGGKTDAGNLVCGHFAVNTYMAVIESALSASGAQRRIKVSAWCAQPYVADWVHYQIFDLFSGGHPPQPRVDIWIDGRITKFSQNDALQVQSELKRLGIG